MMEEALEALQRGDYVRTVALTDQLVAIDADQPHVRALRARALLYADAGEEALAEARRAVDLDPDDDQVHLILGLAAWRCGRLHLAQQSLENAIRRSGGKPGMLADYAWFMASERGPRLAEDAALEAVGMNDKSSTAWAALGLAQFRLRRRRDAEASLTRALELDPNDPYAQSVMANLLHDRHDDGQALALTRLLEDTPGTEELVGRLRREAKQRQVAKMLVERGVQLPRDVPQGRFARWVWSLLTAGVVLALCVAVWPHTLAALGICVLFPLALYWCLRQIID
jgi:Tfp pilus assembly protein PilF